MPYDKQLLSASIDIIKNRSPKISSELDYIEITNDFYNKNWTSNSEEADERYEGIWQELSYIYKANLSDEKMMDLLRTRSGIVTVTAYSRTQDKIGEFESKISSFPLMNADERYVLFLKLRTYSTHNLKTG